MRRCSTLLFLALPLGAQNPVIRQGASPTGAVDFTSAATTKPLRIATTLPTSCTTGELLFLLNVGVYQCVNGAFAATGNGGTWGTIGGTLASQTDLWNALQAKQPLITIGTPGQYLRGDGSLGTLAAGSNVTLTQSGNALTISASGTGGGGGLALSGTPATNDLLSYNGSAAADSGVAVNSGVVTAAGFQTTGTGSTQITFSEGSAPATPNTNQRVLWADSAQHWLRTTDFNGVNWMLMRATTLGASGNGVKWNADGSLGDLGYAPPSSAGANANGYYLVNQATNAPTNAANLGALPSGLVKASVSGNVATVSTVSTARAITYSFNGNGAALSAGAKAYLTVPYACTITAWNISVDAGAATIDVWKTATGTAIPTVSNTITASATPAIASGTTIHSTNLTGWTTAVASNDVMGFNLKAVTAATFANLTLECDQ